jgi:hypothetical protein
VATLLKPYGAEVEVKPSDPKKGFSLKELYSLITCITVEMITLSDGRTMWVDEEAKLKPNPHAPNRKATQLLAKAGGMPGDVVLGNALICSKGEVK